MIVRKCEHIGCEKAGICKCPKDRSLSEYWHFCRQHAAEYNKNWNYYAGMTADEINKEWEKDTFGDNRGFDADYYKLVGDFLNTRAKIPEKSIPSNVIEALRILGLTATDNWMAIQKTYRMLAKQEHPDTNKTKDQSRFAKISGAYRTLKKYYNK
ncbi:MAG: DnaJ domain-containing protein [Rickettsiales bacterium]|jgi:DnaJ-domain-containing protein 1|nr:DnaJ domain-containing protein [Rickettsiales bacterium]